MKKLMMLIVLCHTASAATHSLMHFITASVGLPNFSEFLGVVAVDGVNVIYCDSSSETFETRQDWMKTAFENNTQLETYKNFCFKNQPVIFRSMIRSLRELFNQSGAHFLQRSGGCEWDENTGEVTGAIQYGYDGEGFIEFDSKTLTWTTLKPEAIIFQQAWNEKPLITAITAIVTTVCPQWLKLYVSTGKSFLQRKVLPSVSLLQRSPSSPISCHATGFYPHRAMMFWRKDGEEIHEGVDPGEILPNNDETSQMSVDLNVSSVTPEDWSRYECVFQLSGVEDGIVTKLNKRVIRTNWMKNRTGVDAEVPITVAVLVLVLILIAVIGFAACKKKKVRRPTSPPDSATELFERLRNETRDSEQR